MGNRLQRRNFQLPGNPPRAGRARAPLSVTLRYRDRPEGISSVGHNRFREIAWYVCVRDMERARKAFGVGTRPDGHQAALLRSPGEGHIFRVRTQSDLGASRDRTTLEYGRARGLFVAELRAEPVDVDRGDQESCAGRMDRMARRKDYAGDLLAAAVCQPAAHFR